MREATAESGEFPGFLEAMGRDVRSTFRTFDGRRFIDVDRGTRLEQLVAAATDPSGRRHRNGAAQPFAEASAAPVTIFTR
jgi:hypothetical protein